MNQTAIVRETQARRKIITWLLIALTLLVALICYNILKPFFSVFSWSLALGVVGYPLFVRLDRSTQNKNLAAAVTVFLIAVLIVGPSVYVVREIITQTTSISGEFAGALQTGSLAKLVESNPKLSKPYRWLNRHLNLNQNMQVWVANLNEKIPSAFVLSIWSVVQFFLVLFTIFFVFRDRQKVLHELQRFVPLSFRETNWLFSRVSETIYATLSGTLIVAMAQGFLGGLMFWILGLPAPVLWGFVMSMLAMVPGLGAAVVWLPTGIYLLTQGDHYRAIILIVWGALAVGLIDNLLYPLIVGRKLHFHTVVIFFFVLGGIMFFGPAGIILGPVFLSVASALLDTWQRRLTLTTEPKNSEEQLAI